MYTAIILGVIVLFMTMVMKGDLWERIRLFLGLSAFALFVFVVISGFMVAILTNRTYEYRDLKIQSIKVNDNNINLNSTFILGTGRVSGGSNATYISYAEYPQGIKRIEVNANNAYVIESNEEQPHIKNFEFRTVSSEVRSKWLLNKKERIGAWEKNTGRYHSRYHMKDVYIVVPENTIVYNFNIE